MPSQWELLPASHQCSTECAPTCKELGLNYGEFQDALYLNDGGVTGNLGIEVLISLLQMQSLHKDAFILVADAERPQTSMPGNSPLADTAAQGTALSDAARATLSERFGKNAMLVSFSGRLPPQAEGLPFDVQTALAPYRTDLDSPTWQEMHALMLHGASICASVMDSTNTKPKPAFDEVKRVAKQVLTEAGAPSSLEQPTRVDLRKCSTRPSEGLISQRCSLVCLCFLMEFTLIGILPGNVAEEITGPGAG